MAEERSLQIIFGEVLRQFRLTNGFTQEKLAELTELHDRYISLLERGLRQPSLTTIFKLSHALNISPIELLKPVVKKYKN